MVEDFSCGVSSPWCTPEFDPANRKLVCQRRTLATATCRADGHRWITSQDGLPLGIRDSKFSETEIRSGGSRGSIYSDGITEAALESGEEYGPESSSPNASPVLLESLLADVRKFVNELACATTRLHIGGNWRTSLKLRTSFFNDDRFLCSFSIIYGRTWLLRIAQLIYANPEAHHDAATKMNILERAKENVSLKKGLSYRLVPSCHHIAVGRARKQFHSQISYIGEQTLQANIRRLHLARSLSGPYSSRTRERPHDAVE